eukprot:500871_1
MDIVSFDYEDTVERVMRAHKRKVAQLAALEQELGLYFDEEEEENEVSVAKARKEHQRKVALFQAIKQEVKQYFPYESEYMFAIALMREINLNQLNVKSGKVHIDEIIVGKAINEHKRRKYSSIETDFGLIFDKQDTNSIIRIVIKHVFSQFAQADAMCFLKKKLVYDPKHNTNISDAIFKPIDIYFPIETKGRLNATNILTFDIEKLWPEFEIEEESQEKKLIKYYIWQHLPKSQTLITQVMNGFSDTRSDKGLNRMDLVNKLLLYDPNKRIDTYFIPVRLKPNMFDSSQIVRNRQHMLREIVYSNPCLNNYMGMCIMLVNGYCGYIAREIRHLILNYFCYCVYCGIGCNDEIMLYYERRDIVKNINWEKSNKKKSKLMRVSCNSTELMQSTTQILSLQPMDIEYCNV